MSLSSLNLESFTSVTSQEWDQIISILGSNVQTASTPHSDISYPHTARSYHIQPKVERERPASNVLGLYAHIPFCNYLCTFCFYAKKLAEQQDEFRRYVNALKEELSWVQPGTRLTQLYIGGGTPTVLPPALLDELLTSIFDRVEAQRESVHTVECSPDSITPEHIQVLQTHGIERVSMGVQSLQKQVLDTVNRRYQAETVLAACDLLVSAGLVLNVDLIYGLPGQTEESFIQDFETLSRHGVHSITAYSLRFNSNTPIGRSIKQEEKLDPLRLVKWRAYVKAIAQELGFEQTRWHTFQRLNPLTAADAASRFTDITSQGNQFSIGVSARSRLNHRIYQNHCSLDTYCQRITDGESPVEEMMDLSEVDRKIRFLTLSLGDGKYLNHQDYLQEFNSSFSNDFAEPLDRLQRVSLIYDNGKQVALTERGKLLYDLVTRAFYSHPVEQQFKDRSEAALSSSVLRLKSHSNSEKCLIKS